MDVTLSESFLPAEIVAEAEALLHVVTPEPVIVHATAVSMPSARKVTVTEASAPGAVVATTARSFAVSVAFGESVSTSPSVALTVAMPVTGANIVPVL